MIKKLKGFEDYYNISDLGVITNNQGKPIKPYCQNGYMKVTLHKLGKMYGKRVHRLVFENFNGDLIEGLVINHIDKDRGNNRSDNLEQIIERDNLIHSKKLGTSKYTFVHKHPKGWRCRVRIKGISHEKIFKEEIDAAKFVKEILEKYNIELKYAVLCT